MVTPKAKGFRPQTLKLVKTWIPYSTPSFILREVKGLRGHLSKSRKDFSLNYWLESQPFFPQQSGPHQVFCISFIAIKCSLCYEVFCMFIKNIILSLAGHFLFFGKGPYARSCAWDEQISPPSLVCKENSSHLHSFWVGLGKQFKSKTSPLFPTWQFVSRKSEIQVLSLSSKYSQLIMNAKTNILHFLTIEPLQLAIHVVQNRMSWCMSRSEMGQRSLMKGLPETLVHNFQFEFLERLQLIPSVRAKVS